MRPVAALIALALLALVAGCGGDEETSTTTAPTAETTADTGTATPPAEAAEEGEGGGEDKGSGGVAAESPGDDPGSALEAFFTSGDPDLVCGELATADLLSSAYGDEKGCRQAQVPGATPKSIEIEALEVTGDEAKATVIPEGGPNDGIETTVTLADDDGWRIESLEADIPAGP